MQLLWCNKNGLELNQTLHDDNKIYRQLIIHDLFTGKTPTFIEIMESPSNIRET